jgi:hypothetical protein
LSKISLNVAKRLERVSKQLAKQLSEKYGSVEIFGEKCFQIVKQKASWKNCVSKMETLYEALL